MVLSEKCLYYFADELDKEPRGIIPLENVVVQEISMKKQKFCFQLTSPSEQLKAAKVDPNSHEMVKSGHQEFIMACSSDKELREWMDAIKKHTCRNPVMELLNKKRDFPEGSPRRSREPQSCASSFLCGVLNGFP